MSKTENDQTTHVDDKKTNSYQKSIQLHFFTQWITSLAVSIICCAVLFILFAKYIVELNNKASMVEVRVELMHERLIGLQNEIQGLRKAPLVQINSAPSQPALSSSEMQGSPGSALGVEITEKASTEPGAGKSIELNIPPLAGPSTPGK